MCNSCECDNMDRCSIRGTSPIAFCCDRCLTINTTQCQKPKRERSYENEMIIINTSMMPQDGDDSSEAPEISEVRFRVSLLHGNIKSTRIYDVLGERNMAKIKKKSKNVFS